MTQKTYNHYSLEGRYLGTCTRNSHGIKFVAASGEEIHDSIDAAVDLAMQYEKDVILIIGGVNLNIPYRNPNCTNIMKQYNTMLLKASDFQNHR